MAQYSLYACPSSQAYIVADTMKMRFHTVRQIITESQVLSIIMQDDLIVHVQLQMTDLTEYGPTFYLSRLEIIQPKVVLLD